MPNANAGLDALVRQEYAAGFVTEIESETLPPGLDDSVVRAISAKKGEPAWLTDWRLDALRRWRQMRPPRWAHVQFPEIDFQAISYYSAPKGDKPKSLDEVDPELLRTYEKLGIPLHERAKLAGVENADALAPDGFAATDAAGDRLPVAVDAVFDSVSIATTFKEQLTEAGVVFCSMAEAVRDHPELVRKYLGSVVPKPDNFYAALNSAVFSDGSFVYVPKHTRCPMELSTYFRINAENTGQFERTLIIADEGRLGELSGRLHGTHARRQSAARCGRGTGGFGRCRDQILDGAKLVSRRRGRGAAASTTSSPNAAPVWALARRSAGRKWKPARPSPGSTPA